jgi:hypothetical protein
MKRLVLPLFIVAAALGYVSNAVAAVHASAGESISCTESPRTGDPS